MSPPTQLAVKFTPVTLAEEIVTDREAGVKVQPVLDGVTVYVPAARLPIEKLLEASLVAEPEPAETLAPTAPALPAIEKFDAVMFSSQKPRPWVATRTIEPSGRMA